MNRAGTTSMSKPSAVCRWALLAALALGSGSLAGADAREYAAQRAALREEIEQMTRHTREETGVEELDPAVYRVLDEVPRHEFVPPELVDVAYQNRPLPIGHGQTISQPYIVALMTHLLAVNEESRVLEIGTGSGYQAAVLSPLVASVYTIEIVAPLAEAARARLERLGYANVSVRLGDGYFGWQEAAPFDAIVVTAAASHVPPALIEQLSPGGRLIIPVGPPFVVQHLLLVEKSAEGEISTRQILPVRFVPLTGEH